MSDDLRGRGPELLRAAMDARGMKQTALETAVGVSKGMASRWLNGERVPELKFALAIEEILGVPPRAWLRDERPSATDG